MSNAPVFGHHVLALEDETVERRSGGVGGDNRQGRNRGKKVKKANKSQMDD